VTRALTPATAALALLVTAGACRSPRPAASTAELRGAPRLLITIVVDQLAAWEAEERWPLLPADGGFARLRREGLTVRELRFDHAATDTAAGHAALFSGATPRASGVVANEVPGPDGKPRTILADEQTRLVGADGVALDRPGSSLARLKVETVADVFVRASPRARVYSFSLKDRGALFGAGRKPTLALWLDVASEQVVTSNVFPPPTIWATQLGSKDALAGARAGGWVVPDADRGWVEARAATPDDQPGEGDLGGLGRAFPHEAIASAKAMRATPVGDRVVFALARGALGEIASDQTRAPALLALSLSSHDYVAHVFGPHSWEAWTALIELDRKLAELLDAADRAVGRDGYAMLLTGDHGGGALPELAPEARGVRCEPGAPADRWERPCAASRRISPREVADSLEAVFAAVLGPGPWVVGVAEPFVYFTARGGALAEADRRKLVEAAKAALAPMGIEDVVDARAATAPCPAGQSRAALVCNAIDPTAPPDLFLLVGPGAFFDPDVVPGFGSSHGSRFLYDRAVPLLVRAPGRVKPGAVRDKPVSAKAFARTAASLLGVPAPEAARTGEDLAPR
jgi:predicted AlkP superfamily pyrophosphatase or phosphodiesterase